MTTIQCLCLMWVFWWSLAQTDNLETKTIHQDSGFVSVKTGDNFTLRCFYYSEIAVRHYWYRQILGQNPRLISTIYKYHVKPTFHNEFINNSRFTIDAESGQNHLTISDMRPSDSATYYCAYGYSYMFEMAEGMIIDVKDSGLNIQVSVQQLESDTMQPGGSVTLNCTVHTGSCDGEHSVYWFKRSDQAYSALIYTHGDKDYHCEKKANTRTRSCVYSLPILSLNQSHAGTYYCAVASCGHIVFGNGTKLDFRQEYRSTKDDVDSSVFIYILSGVVTFSTILLVSFVWIMSAYEEFCARFSDASTKSSMDDQNKNSLCYTAGRTKKMRRSRGQPDDTWTECIYFSVE